LVYEFGGGLRFFSGKAVNDSAVSRVLFADEIQKLVPGIFLENDLVMDIGAVETVQKGPAVLKLQFIHDFPARHRIGRGGQGDAGNLGESFVKQVQLQIFPPEIMSPLGDAVGLVDGEKGQGSCLKEAQEGICHKPLRRDVQEVQISFCQTLFDLPGASKVQAGIQKGGADAH